MEKKNNSLTNISYSICCADNLRKGVKILVKPYVFIFHHSIQHDETSGYTFHDEISCLD